MKCITEVWHFLWPFYTSLMLRYGIQSEVLHYKASFVCAYIYFQWCLQVKWNDMVCKWYIIYIWSYSWKHVILPLKAEDISGERTSIYPLLPRSSAAGWHPAAVPYEQESHQVQRHCHELRSLVCVGLLCLWDQKTFWHDVDRCEGVFTWEIALGSDIDNFFFPFL